MPIVRAGVRAAAGSNAIVSNRNLKRKQKAVAMSFMGGKEASSLYGGGSGPEWPYPLFLWAVGWCAGGDRVFLSDETG